MRAIIDYDVLCYRCGFASEHTSYNILEKGSDIKVYTANSMKEVHAFIGESQDLYPVKQVTPEPLANCLHSVKISIQSILDEVKAVSFSGYLTGKDQFREKVAMIKPYKGNRDPSHKPFYYKEIKEYLINKWKAQVVEYYEADDAMAQEQYKDFQLHERICEDTDTTNSPILCTIDKDLNQIPGWHYNFVKKETFWVTEAAALRFFYEQLIAGDPTDNIPGIPGYGPKKAAKAILNCTTGLDMYTTAVALYTAHFHDEVIAHEALHDTARLVYIIKEKDLEWSPPA